MQQTPASTAYKQNSLFQTWVRGVVMTINRLLPGIPQPSFQAPAVTVRPVRGQAPTLPRDSFVRVPQASPVASPVSQNPNTWSSSPVLPGGVPLASSFVAPPVEPPAPLPAAPPPPPPRPLPPRRRRQPLRMLWRPVFLTVRPVGFTALQSANQWVFRVQYLTVLAWRQGLIWALVCRIPPATC